MSNKNTIPFMVGAITGAVGLATVALLCSDNNTDSEKTYKQDIDEIIKQLNRLFFVASGMSLKIQFLFGKISSAEMAEIKYSFSGLYSRQKDRVENYFYYLDHVEEFEEIQEELISSYTDSSALLKNANSILKQHNEDPVSFKGMRPAVLTSDEEYSSDDVVSVIRMCDSTLDFCENLMSRVDLIIDKLEKIRVNIQS